MIMTQSQRSVISLLDYMRSVNGVDLVKIKNNYNKIHLVKMEITKPSHEDGNDQGEKVTLYLVILPFARIFAKV